MAVQLCYLVVTFLVYLEYTDAGGSCQENIYLEVGMQGLVSCHFENFDIIGWINGTADVTNTSPFIYLERSQIYGQGYESGDYGLHPNGSLIINEVKLTNEFNYTVLFVPSGGANEYVKVPVKVYVPPDLGYPVVDGRANQVVIRSNTRGFINCSMTGIRPRVDLEWAASSDEISLNSEHRVTDNSDGTYNTYLTSSYNVVNSPTWRVSLICRVAGQMEDLFPSVTTVYLLLEQHFPVVNGLVHQQHVVLNVNREDKLTCTKKRVSQTMVLEWVFTPPVSPDEISIENELSKTDNRDGTSNITLSSSFRVLSQSIHYVTMECRVVDENDGSQHDVTTVALLFDKTTDQEYESVLSWEPTLAIVLILSLANITIFWLIFIFWMKRHKDFARKYHWIVANPGHKTDLKEAGAADHQSVQEMQPMQPVSNKDNIEAGCAQCSHFREMRTKNLHLPNNRASCADSGVSSSPCRSTASGDRGELEGRNAQDIEPVVC